MKEVFHDYMKASPSPLDEPYEVYKNPTSSELVSLARKSRYRKVRGLMLPEKKLLYVWIAEEDLHYSVAKNLGILHDPDIMTIEITMKNPSDIGIVITATSSAKWRHGPKQKSFDVLNNFPSFKSFTRTIFNESVSLDF